MGSQLGSDSLIGFAMVVPATAMIVTGHIWLGAAIVAAVVVAGVFSARTRIRAEAAEQQGYLSYAHTATSLGADPAPVIKAMRGSDEDWDDGSPAVHLPPKHR
jgi:ABC-type methionine transport system permease subunit